MVSHKLFITTVLFVLKDYGAYSQTIGSNNEVINQNLVTQTVSTAPTQSSGQFVIPAIIRPIFEPEPYPGTPSYGSPFAQPPPAYPNALSSPPMMPPIIIEGKKSNDDLTRLLYILLFASLNNRGCDDCGNCGGYNYGGCGNSCGGYCGNGCGSNSGSYGYNGCGCGSGSNCGCGCSNSYLTYPIPYTTCGSSIQTPVTDISCGYCNDCSQPTCIQACNGGAPNEITLTLTAAPSCG